MLVFTKSKIMSDPMQLAFIGHLRSLVVRALERYSKDPGSSPGGDACFSHKYYSDRNSCDSQLVCNAWFMPFILKYNFLHCNLVLYLEGQGYIPSLAKK